jgi:outer membrane protein assembly factor BamB
MAGRTEAPRDPDVLWRWDSGKLSELLWVSADENAVVVADSGPKQTGDYVPAAGRVTLLDVNSGTERWHRDTASRVYPAVVAAERIYAGTADGTVFAWDRLTGAEVWRLAFPGVPAELAIVDGTLVIADTDTRSWAVEPSVSPESYADLNRLGGQIWGVDPNAGGVLWEKRVGTGGTFMATDESMLVVAAPGDGNAATVSRVDPATGEPSWSADMSVTSRPAIGGGMVVVPGRQLVALDLETGEQVWAAAAIDEGTFFMPAFAGGYIEVATTGGILQLRSPADGALVTYAEAPRCTLALFEFDGAPFANCFSGLVALRPSAAGNWLLVLVAIPQGDMPSVAAVPGRGIVFSSGIGFAPDGVTLVRPHLS